MKDHKTKYGFNMRQWVTSGLVTIKILYLFFKPPYIQWNLFFMYTVEFVLYVLKDSFFFFLVVGNLCYLHIAKLVPQVCCEILLGVSQFVIDVM